MFENIIFGIMVIIAIGAGIFTCIYEVGGSSSKTKKGQTEPNQTEKGSN
ncbi:MAG: hypothetical protein J6D08_17880 [Lachnospiraceae bacterium]|nr:hypothetical protein [Lachnospiraceae bacterium]